MTGKETCCLSFADLLEYPTGNLAAKVEACGSLMEGCGEAERHYDLFCNHALGASLESMQELYTATFDLDPVCSPYAGYHLFGESYGRGALMAKLKESYRECSLDIGTELPDHLSCLLRFVAVTADENLARDLIEQILLPALERMLKVLGEAGNPYTGLLRSLLLVLQDAPATLRGGQSDG